MTQDQKKALTQIAQAAVACERATGFPAEISAAQCILESGYLRHAPGNNCFGIKDTDRQPGCQYKVTKEYLDGSWQTCKLAFEVFPTLEACFTDHAKLLTGGFGGEPNCYRPAWVQYLRDHDLDKLIAGIAEHYATDPQYRYLIRQLAFQPSTAAAIVTARTTAQA